LIKLQALPRNVIVGVRAVIGAAVGPRKASLKEGIARRLVPRMASVWYAKERAVKLMTLHNSTL